MANTYSAGTLAVTNGNKSVTLSGGLSIALNMKPGDFIAIEGGLPNAVESLTDNTHFLLARPYDGEDDPTASYIVIHMPTGWGDRSELAEQTAEIIRLFSQDLPFTADQLAAATASVNQSAADAEAAMVAAAQSEALSDIAAETATAQAAIAIEKAGQTTGDRTQTGADRALTGTLASQAQLARDAALAGKYLDIATGRAAVADGQTFIVLGTPGSAVSYRVYRRTATGQDFVTDGPSATGLSSKVSSQELDPAAPQFDPVFFTASREVIAGGKADGSFHFEGGYIGVQPDGQGRIAAHRGNMAINGLTPMASTIEGVGFFLSDSQGSVYYAQDENGLALYPVAEVPEPPAPVVVGSLLRSNDVYLRNGELVQFLPTMTDWSGWGSSSMQGIASQMVILANELGAGYYNGGKGGERMEHHAARQGGVKALVTFPDNTIPASGSVAVTISNFPPASQSSSLQPFQANVGDGGVLGTLSCDGAGFYFARATAGAAIAVAPDTPLFPVQGIDHRDGVQFLWMGKNTFSQTVPGAEQVVIQKTDTCHDYVAAFVPRVIIVGQFVDGGTPAVSVERDQIYATNAHQKKRYRDRFVDVHAYITSPQVWADTGIAPTQADLDAQAIGNKPPSISSDNGHFNSTGYAAVKNLIRARLLALGWYTLA